MNTNSARKGEQSAVKEWLSNLAYLLLARVQKAGAAVFWLVRCRWIKFLWLHYLMETNTIYRCVAVAGPSGIGYDIKFSPNATLFIKAVVAGSV